MGGRNLLLKMYETDGDYLHAIDLKDESLQHLADLDQDLIFRLILDPLLPPAIGSIFLLF